MFWEGGGSPRDDPDLCREIKAARKPTKAVIFVVGASRMDRCIFALNQWLSEIMALQNAAALGKLFAHSAHNGHSLRKRGNEKQLHCSATANFSLF